MAQRPMPGEKNPTAMDAIAQDWDLIVIGSGPGGAALAQALAPTGKRILILERGDYLPREEANWDPEAVFVEGRYQADETWMDADGAAFQPGLHYYVGGNSKVYGSALFRLREGDFSEVRHPGGISPAWPVSYAEFEPWYAKAEALFHVHGTRGSDPTEPWASGPYPYSAVSHEPRIERFARDLQGQGLTPFPIPLGILLDEKDGKPTPTSPCMRCSYFDGFPCPMNGKADAQVMCIDPMLAAHPNVTLLTGALATALETDASGRRVSAVHVEHKGQARSFRAPIIVAACGALSTALLMQRSSSVRHPDGLANSSGQLGRNYMRHEMSVLAAISREVNDTVFQKTLAFADWYWGTEDHPWPIGLVQMMATSHTAQIKAEELPKWLEWLPDMPFDQIARHSMDFWLQAEDLPHPENRIYEKDGKVHLDIVHTDRRPLDELKRRTRALLHSIDKSTVMIDRALYFGKNIPISGTSHQAGTARMGTDPANSVLDTDCRAHDLDNLYVTDASFFPSIGAVNPTLTIIANALRVADRIKDRL